MKTLLVDLDFDNAEALTEFITAKRQAEHEALSDVERCLRPLAPVA